MTREEAISILLGIQSDNLNLDNTYTKDKYEALDMAIKSLKQEPCCSCIEFKRYAKEMGFEIEQEPTVDKIKAIVDEWQSDTWTDNLSYECMVKIAELVEPQESEVEE